MHQLRLVFVFAVACHLTLIHQSDAMYGLCSTNWMSNDGCYDNNDECRGEGGACYHDGHGDHGEGCVCKKIVNKGNFYEYELVTKSHLPSKWMKPA